MTAAPAVEGEPLTAAEAATLFRPLADQEALIVAVSGGPDSVALLALLADWARQGRPRLLAVTVDHGLRPEAAQEAQMVGRLCSSLGVEHRTKGWPGHKPGTGVQEKARAARYGLLAEEARALGSAAIVTAHTLDDQAETLLMRMAAGSGLAGLSGMAPRSAVHGVVLARPLLGVAKARLVATCQARGLAFVRDPSNDDPRFARIRWRKLLPVLAREGLSAERLGQLAHRSARADHALAHRAMRALSQYSLPPACGVEGLGMGGRTAGGAPSSSSCRAAAPSIPALPTANEGGKPPGAPDRPRGLAPADERQLDFASLCQEPEEIVIRCLALCLSAARNGEADPDVPLRLARLEDCAQALIAASREGRALRRTLGGFRLLLGRDGVLTLVREGERRRGVHPATVYP